MRPLEETEGVLPSVDHERGKHRTPNGRDLILFSGPPGYGIVRDTEHEHSGELYRWPDNGDDDDESTEGSDDDDESEEKTDVDGDDVAKTNDADDNCAKVS